MNASNKTTRALTTGLILGALALAGLGNVGCDREQLREAVAVLTSGHQADSVQAAKGAGDMAGRFKIYWRR